MEKKRVTLQLFIVISFVIAALIAVIWGYLEKTGPEKVLESVKTVLTTGVAERPTETPAPTETATLAPTETLTPTPSPTSTRIRRTATPSPTPGPTDTPEPTATQGFNLAALEPDTPEPVLDLATASPEAGEDTEESDDGPGPGFFFIVFLAIVFSVMLAAWAQS